MGLAVLPTSGYKEDAYLYAHEVLANWSQTTVNWNNQPAHDEKHLDYTLVKKGEANAKSAQVDITNLVRKWYSNKADNFGVMLDSHGEQAIEMCSSENMAYTSTARPIVYVNYVSNAGLESYFTYESFGAGRAGTAHVALHRAKPWKAGTSVSMAIPLPRNRASSWNWTCRTWKHDATLPTNMTRWGS